MATTGSGPEPVNIRWDGLGWRVVDRWGNTRYDKGGAPIAFDNEEAALAWVAENPRTYLVREYATR